MSDNILIELVETFLQIKKHHLRLTLDNHLKILALFLSIENLEWSAYILRDLFNN